MQKALMQMNVQLYHAVSDITGVTTLSIVRAIVSGERDPSVLSQYRDVRCKKTPEVLSDFRGINEMCYKNGLLIS